MSSMPVSTGPVSAGPVSATPLSAGASVAGRSTPALASVAVTLLLHPATPSEAAKENTAARESRRVASGRTGSGAARAWEQKGQRASVATM
nr:hypothetical protein [Deltaproteobacteria bacterium]